MKHQDREVNRSAWDRIAARGKGRTALPRYGPLCPREDELHLLETVGGARVLELGCGSGHSLLYLAERGAAELWGLDISPAQIQTARHLLETADVMAQLFESPMEENPGLPTGHFDLVISIYALGWTTDLPRTLSLAASYLKPGGSLIFSWEHPFFSCLRAGGENLIIGRSYSYEGPLVDLAWGDVPIALQARKLSTYLNGVIQAGLTIERVIEGDLRPDEDGDFPRRWYSQARAGMVPTTMIIKARKT